MTTFTKLSEGLELSEDIFFGEEADVFIDDLAVFDEGERRDGLNIELCGEFAFIIDIDFGDFVFTFVFLSDFEKDGANHFAGAAPRCPEINDDRDFGVDNFGLECGLSDVD